MLKIKKCVKLEEVAEPSKGDYESQQPSVDSRSKSLLFIKKETQPVQNRALAETLMDEKMVDIDKYAVKEENTNVQQRSPITILSKDEKCVKLEEVAEPSKGDYESQQPSFDSENKFLLSIHKESQPVQNKAPAEALIDEKIVFTENILGDEENTKVQQRSPITILSEDEGYLLEGDELTVSAETRVGTHRKFYSQEDKTVMPKKKKIKVKEFASIMHQGKSLNMVGEFSPGWRPKNRSKKKLMLNMKRLLNPKLNTEEVTMLDNSS